MTRFAPLWQQANTYPASLDRMLLYLIGGANGGMWGNQPSRPQTVVGTMNVRIPGPGMAVVPLYNQSSQGNMLCRWDADETVTIPAAPPGGQSRIDLVTLQVRDNVLDAGPNNDFIFTSVQGAPTSGTPVAPYAGNNAWPLLQILVPGAAANLNSATTYLLATALNPRTSVYRAGALSSNGTGADTVFPFDTIAEDYSYLYNNVGLFGATAANAFWVPIAGRYLVTARIAVQTAGSGAPFWAQAQLWKNGAKFQNGPYGWNPQNGAGGLDGSLTTVVRCNGQDRLQIYYACSAATAFLLGQTVTWANFDYLGM